MPSLPYATASLPGIGGAFKARPEDFFVQEIPLYEPSGAGEHVYCEIQKVGISTFDAINRIAVALGVSTRDVGYAGMKDARAVSRQVLSIHGTSEQAISALHLPDITIQWAARHGNKLRLGHLRANRFAIRLRDVNPTDVIRAQAIIAELEKSGLPNYFGEQRFGRRGDNHLLGAALIRGDDKGLLSLLLGEPRPGIDDRHALKARAAFDAGDLSGAMKAFPRHCGMERRILAKLIKTKRPSAAVRAVDQRLRRLWVSALQSKLFNEVVARRIATIGQLMDGDLAFKHENGAVFHVEAASVEQPRADAFEISPTGPLVGYRVSMPTGQPLAIEEAVFAEAHLKPADFRAAGRHKVKGARRPLRVRPTDVEVAGGVDEHGAFVLLAFTLPAGSFATSLLWEVMKKGAGASAGAEAIEDSSDDAADGDEDDQAEPPV